MSDDLSGPRRSSLRRRIILAIVFVAVAGVAATFMFTPEDKGDPESGETSTGSLGSVDGIELAGFGTDEKVTLDALHGKPLVINYWASWCLFCIDEMPDFQEVYEDVSQRVEFLGVNIEDQESAARRLADATGVRYPLAVDEDGSVYRKLRGFSMPTTWFISEEGQIVERFSGPLTADQLRQRIGEHFGP